MSNNLCCWLCWEYSHLLIFQTSCQFCWLREKVSKFLKLKQFIEESNLGKVYKVPWEINVSILKVRAYRARTLNLIHFIQLENRELMVGICGTTSYHAAPRVKEVWKTETQVSWTRKSKSKVILKRLLFFRMGFISLFTQGNFYSPDTKERYLPFNYISSGSFDHDSVC